jgi:O-succinylbenzoic acid--CoA ligase
MHTPHYTKIHNRFLLNGFFYDFQGLKEVAYSFIKEGDFFERYMGDFLMDWLDQDRNNLFRDFRHHNFPKANALQETSLS